MCTFHGISGVENTVENHRYVDLMRVLDLISTEGWREDSTGFSGSIGFLFLGTSGRHIIEAFDIRVFIQHFVDLLVLDLHFFLLFEPGGHATPDNVGGTVMVFFAESEK